MKINQYYKIFVFAVFVLFAQTAVAQNVGISSSSSFTPDASAALDVSYSSKGLLIPRVALTATNAAGPITSPATSLLVYNTASAGSSPYNVIPGYYYWNGSAWVLLSTSAQATGPWSTTGNAGTSYPTNYLGTSDNFGLHVKTNATHRFWIDSLGSVAVGISPVFSSSREKFLVDAGSTSANPTPTGAFNVISGKGYLDSYLQLNIQNNSATAAASSDIVASNDQATETANYIDMGINSSAYTVGGLLGGPSTAYLLATGNDFTIGNGSLNKNLLFFTAGTTSPATNTERMRIDPSGNVGIGTTAPTQKLDITGNLKFSGALMPNNNAGSTGNFLVSAGATNPPVWFNANTYAWLTGGNSGTTAGTNFLGTTDAVDLVLKTNNAERARINSVGDVSIGGTALNTSNPEQLLVDAGTTSSFNVISGKGNLNNYLQLNIQNNNAGTAASSDVVASNDMGSETANFIDMGINSSGNTSTGVLGGANTAYLYSTGNDFGIGNGAASKNLLFFTSGTASTPTYAERMRIDPNGNIGIGTASPATKLHIFGANPLTLSGVVNGTNTSADSVLTITSGLVRKLPLSTFAVATNAWSTTGNAGTTAGTNFIGTTDAVDMSFKANGVERLRIINGSSSTTGTTGDIVVGDANSGTLRSTKEMVLRQDGDVYGQSSLRLRNRNGQNGAIFETTGGSANLVDFIFNTGSVSSPISSNIRFETRSGSNKVSGNSTEWQIGQPDAVNGGPTLIVGAAGTGSSSAFLIGNVGIANNAPTEKLDVTGNLKFSGALMPGNSAGTAGYVLQSAGSGAAPTWFSIPDASASVRGYVSTGAQTFAGVKTFSSTPTFSAGATFSGAVNYPILVAAANVNLTASNYTVINPSGSTYSVTLPAVASNTGRVYVIVNQSSSTAITISSYINFAGNAVTSVPTQSSITVQSNGINWYRIQ